MCWAIVGYFAVVLLLTNSFEGLSIVNKYLSEDIVRRQLNLIKNTYSRLLIEQNLVLHRVKYVFLTFEYQLQGCTAYDGIDIACSSAANQLPKKKILSHVPMTVDSITG